MSDKLKIGTKVEIVSGLYRGEKGKVMERYHNSYAIKLLTGPHKDERGTFVALPHEVRS